MKSLRSNQEIRDFIASLNKKKKRAATQTKPAESDTAHSESIQKVLELNLRKFRGVDQSAPSKFLDDDHVTDKEIQEHFAAVRNRWKEEEELRKLEQEEEQKASSQADRFLRYNETLTLGRKGYQSCFRAITRSKRDVVLAGGCTKGPPLAHYRPKFEMIDRKITREFKYREEVEPQTELIRPKKQICSKVIKTLRRQIRQLKPQPQVLQKHISRVNISQNRI